MPYFLLRRVQHMKIMSYNINCFKGKKGPLTNMSENIHKISSFIKGFLVADIDNLVILQEVPYKNFEIYHNAKKIDENKFVFFYSDIIGKPNFITIGIANKDSNWKKTLKNNKFGFYYFKTVNNSNVDYLNRFVEVYNRKYDLIVLGLHMPCNKSENESIVSFWSELSSYKNKIKNPFIIVGDLNAELNENSTFGKELNTLGGKDLINAGTFPTSNGVNSIDHMLVYNCENLINYSHTGEVLNFIDYSDHYPILSPPIKKLPIEN